MLFRSKSVPATPVPAPSEAAAEAAKPAQSTEPAPAPKSAPAPEASETPETPEASEASESATASTTSAPNTTGSGDSRWTRTFGPPETGQLPVQQYDAAAAAVAPSEPESTDRRQRSHSSL